MQTTQNQSVSRSTLIRRLGLGATIAMIVASAGSAGLVGPGGDTHFWTGSATDSWNNPVNWTGIAVPANEDAVIVDGGPFNNIFLNADSASLASIFISGFRTVSTNGFRLSVNSSSGSTTISGLDSNLFVANNGAATALETNELSIENQGRLQMSGGIAHISEQLTMSSAARLTGNGLVEVNSPNAAAFNGLGGSLIAVGGGGGADLTIRVIGGGSIVLPPLINVLSDNASLIVEGPFFLDDLTDINLGMNTGLDIDDSWNLLGTLNADPGAGFAATVMGGSFGVDGSIEVDSGALFIDPSVTLRNGSTVNISPNSMLVLNSSHFVSAGQNTVVWLDGLLRINGTQIVSAWNGDITLNASALEVNEPQIGSWRMNGDLTFGAFLGQMPRLDGTALMSMSGSIMAMGQGFLVENNLRLEPSAVMLLDQPGTRVLVRNALTQNAGAEISGLGFIDIADTGTMTMVEPVDLNVDVVNAGLFQINGGSADVGYAYIDGAYTQQATGVLEVQIAGPTPLERDVYELSQSATLAGSLNVTLIDMYTPIVGDTFTVLTANGGLVAAFDSLDGDPGFEVSYVGNDVIVTYVGLDTCPTDLNGDGVTDTADLGILLAAFGDMNPEIDLNGDGVVDTADLGIMLAQFGSACP